MLHQDQQISPSSRELQQGQLSLPSSLSLSLSLQEIRSFLLTLSPLSTIQVLEIEKNNVKALFRRAQCYVQMMKLDDARTDLDAALLADPNNAVVKKELALVEKKIAAQKQKEKKMYSKMFS
jgi:tetratricopeptide (TPR) repeat protein